MISVRDSSQKYFAYLSHMKIKFCIFLCCSLYLIQTTSGQNYTLYGDLRCTGNCDSSWLVGLDYTTGLLDTTFTFNGKVTITNYYCTSDPFNCRYFFQGSSSGMPFGFWTFDIPALSLADTSLYIYSKMEYDPYHNRIIFPFDSTLYTYDLETYQVNPLCWIIPVTNGTISGDDRIFDPLRQKYIYMIAHTASNSIEYVVVDVGIAQVINSVTVPEQNAVFNLQVDMNTGLYYGIKWDLDKIVSFDPYTGSYQVVASLPPAIMGMANLELQAFDSKNARYIIPYVDGALNNWCDAINVLTGNIDYHIPFPGFGHMKIFKSADPRIYVHSDTLTIVYCSGYQWYLNNTIIPGATDQSYHPLVSGTYKCLASICDNQNVFSDSIIFSPTGIFPIADNLSSIIITPNPTNGIIKVESRSALKHIDLFNLLGEKVMAAQLPTANCQLPTEINIGLLPPGIYILQASSEGKVWRGKVVKE